MTNNCKMFSHFHIIYNKKNKRIISQFKYKRVSGPTAILFIIHLYIYIVILPTSFFQRYFSICEYEYLCTLFKKEKKSEKENNKKKTHL